MVAILIIISETVKRPPAPQIPYSIYCFFNNEYFPKEVSVFKCREREIQTGSHAQVWRPRKGSLLRADFDRGRGRGHKAPINGVWRWGDKLGRTQWGRTAAGGRFTFRTGFLRVKSRLVSLRASCYSWLRNRASPRGCSPSDGIRHPFTACWMWGTRHWGGTGKARSPETENREARDPSSSPCADQHSS